MEEADQDLRVQKEAPPDDQGPFSADELMTAVGITTRRVIVPRLRAHGLDDRWKDDVAGEVVASAWQARFSFDPELGVLQGWINRIAQRRAADRIRLETHRNGELLSEDVDGDGYTVEEQLARAGEQARRGQVDDIAVFVAEKLAIDSWLEPILAATSGVMEPSVFVHGFLTHVRYDCDVRKAAAAFGISEAKVREYKRSLELHAQVILRAWHKRVELAGEAPRLRDLIECLPEPGVAGSWTRDMAGALVTWAGPVSEVPVEHVQEHTGWTFDTSRQYLATTKTLLRVALGVLSAAPNTTKGGMG